MDEVPDRLPPNCQVSEQCALGSCLMESSCTSELLSYGIREEYFFDFRHRMIFRILEEMDTAGLPIDVSTFLSEAITTQREKDCGGAAYLSEMMMQVTSTANLSYWVDKLRQKYQSRQVIVKCTELVSIAYVRTDKIEAMLDEAEVTLRSLKHVEVKSYSMWEVGQDVADAIEEAGKGNIPGIKSGLFRLDEVIGGFQNGDLITLAGRPGSGKSSLATTIIENIAIKDRHHVTIFSLEMTRHEIAARIMSSISLVNIQAKLRGVTSNDEERLAFKQARVKLGNAPFEPMCSPGITIPQLIGKARLIKEKLNTELIIVDYLQAVNGPVGSKQNRSQIVSDVARALKNLAMELNVPVIALAQLNREVEKENRKPMLSDLKESSGIEEASNIVGLLHLSTPDKERNGVLPVDLLIAKSRHGETTTVKLGFQKRITKFVRDPGETIDTDYLPTQEQPNIPYRDL